MRMTILGFGFEVGPALLRHVRERVEQSFGAASGRIEDVTIRLRDINGDRGGQDMRCRIALRLSHRRTMVVEAVHSDVYAAVDEAARRAREAIWRQLKKFRTLRREHANRKPRRQAG